jgi:membrane protease YdiL (CAAX protease family)
VPDFSAGGRPHGPAIAFSTPAHAVPWQRWLVYSPVARIVIFVVVTSILLFACQLGLTWLAISDEGGSMNQRALAYFVSLALPTIAAYLLLVRVVEHRRPDELALARFLPHAAAGTAAGIVLISAVVGLLWLLGSYHVEGFNGDVHWLAAFLAGGLASAVAEEIVFRGVLFRITEEGLGTWAALAISALVFGLIHIVNPAATTWSSAAVAIEAGLLLGLVYHLWRSLPLCMGVHLGWNFAEGAIYGIPVSGAKFQGWLESSRSGPDWLSGGSFGAEASVVAVAISLVCSVALLMLARRRQTVVSPRLARDSSNAAPLRAG